ncbi:MAG TPA: hypothetical protein PKD55_23645 [Bellilinea sp.]|nr:hypothetical protein [Bellilinea sp.]
MAHKEAKRQLVIRGPAPLLDRNVRQVPDERKAIIRQFIDTVLLDNIYTLENDACTKLQHLIESFVSTSPGISSDIDLVEIRDDIYDRVIDNYRPGKVSPILLTKAYFIIQNLIDEQNTDCARLYSVR